MAPIVCKQKKGEYRFPFAFYTAGDALTTTHLRFFTTHDQDNDNSGGLNCAATFKGGWWFKKCNKLDSNLNGEHGREVVANYMGIQWITWKGYQTSLRGSEMKMRRNVPDAITGN